MGQRIVIDANVFASALINPRGLPGVIISRVIKDKDWRLLLSQSIIEELERILFYPKVRARIPLSNEEIDMWLTALQLIARITVPRFNYPVLAKEDPDDDHYLITAIEGKAQVVISGDKHLLDLKTYQGIKIMKPADFLSDL